jgi:hypothetical protein
VVFCPGIQPLGTKEVIYCDEDQNQSEQTTGLVVEEKANEKEEGVSQQALVLDQAKHCEHDGEESPEIELGKQQRMSLVEREQLLQKVERYVGKTHHNS